MSRKEMTMAKAKKRNSLQDVIPYPEQYCPETEVLGPVLAVLAELIPYPYMECEYTSATVKVKAARTTTARRPVANRTRRQGKKR
jgi:hypothetical protein